MSIAEEQQFFSDVTGSGKFSLVAPSQQAKLRPDSERRMKPWLLENMGDFHPSAALLDFAAVLVMALLLTKQVERRFRERLRWQFRLSSALVLMALVGVGCSLYVNWRDGRVAERIALEKIAAPDPADPMEYSRALATVGWHTPEWLPECIAKLSIFGDSFERIDGLRFMNSPPDNLGELSHMPFLRHLVIHEHGPYQNVFEKVLEFPKLESLELDIDRCDAEQLAKLSRLPNLKCLDIGYDAFNDAVVDEVNSIHSLEQLGIRCAPYTRVNLRGLRNLRKVVVTIFSGDRHHFPMTHSPALRLSDLPNLAEIVLDGVRLDDELLGDLYKLPSLERLMIWDPAGNVRSLSLGTISTLREVSLYRYNGESILVGDLALLKSFECRFSDSLCDLRFGNVPNLECLKCEFNRELRHLDIHASGTTALDLSNCSMKPELLDEIGCVGDLRTLDLTETGLTDSQLGGLPLAKLHELNLSGNSISLKVLKSLNRLPDLVVVRKSDPAASASSDEFSAFKAAHPTTVIEIR